MATHRVQQYKPGDFSLGQIHEFLGAFGRRGGTPELLQAGIEDEELMSHLVRFWQSGGYEATTIQRVAREIMRFNFFGIEEAVQHLGVKPTRAQLATLAEIPFTEAELRQCRVTHILVAVFPLSILDIRKKVECNLFHSYNCMWYNTKSFAKKRGNVRWHLILKEPVLNSIDKTWDEQQDLLGENEETPEIRVMLYTIIGHYLATDRRLFENIRVRCGSDDFGGDNISVGHFNQDGLRVHICRNSYRYYHLGLASSRKPQS